MAVLVLLVHSGIKPGIVIDRGFLDGAFHFSAGDYLAGLFMDTVTGLGSCTSSVDGLRSFRLRASPMRRPAPPGPGWRVRRLIVARGRCCWFFEIAPGIDGVRFWRGAGDIQGRHTEHSLPGNERAGAVNRAAAGLRRGAGRYSGWATGDKCGGDQPRLW